MRRIDRIVTSAFSLLATWLAFHFRLVERVTGPLDPRLVLVVDGVRSSSPRITEDLCCSCCALGHS